MNSDVEKIKERLDIVDLISSYIKVEKSGKNFKACCPFHNEKTPSLFISPDRGTFYCFGCGKKGDVFSFVEFFEGIDFIASLKILADKAGVILSNTKFGDKSEKDKGFKILDCATNFFQNSLSKNESAKKYLKDRGVNDETIEKWRIGCVENNWSDLYNDLKQLGFEDREIEEVGLIKKGDKGNYYDRFRGRIMFPIANASEKIVGFTGRILIPDDKQAKYVNSPETAFFSKSHILYGLHLAKTSIRKNNFSILVEGQFDAIMSHQIGYTNTVATSGTALTDDQLTQLARISSRIVIALDADGAGFRASEKVWQLALSKGMDVKIAKLPLGKDPADLVKDDPEEWKKAIRGATHIIDCLIEQIDARKLERRTLAIEIHKILIPYINKLESAIEQSHFIEKISRKFNLSQDVLWREVSEVKNIISTQEVKVSEKTEDKKSISDQLLGILFWQKSKSNPDIDVLKLENKIIEIMGKDSIELAERNPNIDAIIFTTESAYPDNKILENTIRELLVRVKKSLLEFRRTEIRKELENSENTNDNLSHDELLKELQEISKNIELLNSGSMDLW
ncbi:MAG: DNA primase [Candidatus Pacebacteria bacterium]|nr:DNA primase [Candidatus Paceibacterota bacterium]